MGFKPPVKLGHGRVITSHPLVTWWRHQMDKFSALLPLCVGSSPVTGEFPSQRPVTRNCYLWSAPGQTVCHSIHFGMLFSLIMIMAFPDETVYLCWQTESLVHSNAIYRPGIRSPSPSSAQMWWVSGDIFITGDCYDVRYSCQSHRSSLWRHQMEIFSMLLARCVENSSVNGEFPSQRPATWSFDILYLRLE